MQVVFRVDSNKTMGIGHFMRCLSFAQFFRDEDIKVNFVTTTRSGYLLKMLEEENIGIVHGKRGDPQEDINWTFAQFKEFWLRILSQVENDLFSLLLTIEESQVRQMKVKLLERDDWLVKQSKMNSVELHAHKLDWFYEFFEDWLGDIAPNQESQIATWVKPDLIWVAIKLRNRKIFQNDLIHLLQFKELLKENLHAWILHPESHWAEEFKTHFEDKKQEWLLPDNTIIPDVPDSTENSCCRDQ